MLGSKHILLILMLAGLCSCHRTNPDFTTEKWLNGDGLQYPLRNDILDDLVQHHKLKGLTYKEVHHLLGYPNWSDSVKGEFYYQIIETRNNMRKFDHIKNLVFYMGKDSVITRFEVYDHHFTYKKN